jgi:hypothetical protein
VPPHLRFTICASKGSPAINRSTLVYSSAVYSSAVCSSADCSSTDSGSTDRATRGLLPGRCNGYLSIRRPARGPFVSVDPFAKLPR